jgi:hypothetical protein
MTREDYLRVINGSAAAPLLRAARSCIREGTGMIWVSRAATSGGETGQRATGGEGMHELAPLRPAGDGSGTIRPKPAERAAGKRRAIQDAATIGGMSTRSNLAHFV